MKKHIPSDAQSPTNAEEHFSKNSSEEQNGIYEDWLDAVKNQDTEPELEDRETWQYVEGTPFHVKGNKNNGYVATMSNYILTEPKETIQEVEDYVRSKPWELMVTVINIVMNIRETILAKAKKEQEKEVKEPFTKDEYNQYYTNTKNPKTNG